MYGRAGRSEENLFLQRCRLSRLRPPRGAQAGAKMTRPPFPTDNPTGSTWGSVPNASPDDRGSVSSSCAASPVRRNWSMALRSCLTDCLRPATSWISRKTASTLARPESFRDTGLVWAPFCGVAHCVSASHPSTKQLLKGSFRGSDSTGIFPLVVTRATRSAHFTPASLVEHLF
jgi:hypothetical protein